MPKKQKSKKVKATVNVSRNNSSTASVFGRIALGLSTVACAAAQTVSNAATFTGASIPPVPPAPQEKCYNITNPSQQVPCPTSSCSLENCVPAIVAALGGIAVFSATLFYACRRRPPVVAPPVRAAADTVTEDPGSETSSTVSYQSV